MKLETGVILHKIPRPSKPLRGLKRYTSTVLYMFNISCLRHVHVSGNYTMRSTRQVKLEE